MKIAFDKKGEYKEYYQNGELKSFVKFKDGKKDGLSESYFKNGKVSIKNYYQNGLAYGVHQEFFESGRIKIKANYEADQLDSHCFFYDETGYLKEERFYINGIVAWEKRYDPDGKLRYFSDFINVKMKRDTIRLEENLEGLISLEASNLDSMVVFVGKLNDFDKLVDTIQVIESDNFQAQFSIPYLNKGNNSFEGLIREIHKSSKKYVEKPFRYNFFIED